MLSSKVTYEYEFTGKPSNGMHQNSDVPHNEWKESSSYESHT
jgi:hypothetical protein